MHHQQHQHQSHQQSQQPYQSHQQQSHQTSHMLVPVSGAKLASQSPRAIAHNPTNAARKRDHNDTFVSATMNPSIKSAVKNLNPTLLSMGAEPPPRSSTPGSTDGSTTVSATSSPGIDQQEQEEFNALNSLHRQNRSLDDDLHFRSVDSHLRDHPNQKNHQQHMQATAASVATATSTITSQQRHIVYQPHMNSTSNSSNGNNEELTPRKRPRKQQFADSSSANKKYAAPTGTLIVAPATPSTSNVHQSGQSTSSAAGSDCGIQLKLSTIAKNCKDLNKPVDFYIKKPRTCTLLDVSWMQNI